MEKILAGLYNQLAENLVSMIPVDWKKIYYLGEVSPQKRSWGSMFYFEDEESNEIIRCHDIPEKFNISEEEFDQILDETNELLIKIYDCFKANEQDPWEQLHLSIDNEGAFNIDFLYKIMKENDGGQMRRELIWAFETFGYKPEEGSYTRNLLEKYLSSNI